MLFRSPELEDDDWDGELEADGEIESTWPSGDHDDDLSNQSTVTLASSTSNSKRPRDDDEAGDGEEAQYLQNGSPGMVRCFITPCSGTEKVCLQDRNGHEWLNHLALVS